VPLLFRKADHLVLYGGTVAGPHSLDDPAIERRAIQVRPYDVVGALVGVGDVAGKLGPVDLLRGKGKRDRRVIAVLHL